MRSKHLIALNMDRRIGGPTSRSLLEHLVLHLMTGLICGVAGAAIWSYLVTRL